MAKNEPQDVDTVEDGDAPLIDLNDASIKKMMQRAEKRGTITIDEINAAIPSDQNEMIEDIMSRLSERGVTVVENAEESEDEEDDKDSEPQIEDEVDPLDDGGPRPAAATKKEPTDRTDDPVRMYLREMGAVELLSREGEIAIAKRIEAAREELIGRGVEVSEPFHDSGGVFHHAGEAERETGPDPKRSDYGSFASFSDPDGNGWLLQEVKQRAPGR